MYSHLEGDIMIRIILFFAILALQFPLSAALYELDLAHSAVNFKIKHLMISTVHGRFDKYDGMIDFDESTNKLNKVDVKIDIDSINTNDTKRDAHLKNPDFFGIRNEKGELSESKRYMTFTMTEAKMKGEKLDKLVGNLTMNGVTKPTTLNVDYKGSTTDPWGNEKIVFTATTKIIRKDFRLNFNKPLEKKSVKDKVAGLMIGEDVEVLIEGEANKIVPAKN